MLDKIVSSSGQILPTTGFWGFLLHNWIAIAIIVMLIGYILDQVLYFIRYQPQEHWIKKYYSFRRFLTRTFGVKPAKEPIPREEAPIRSPLEDTGITMHKTEREQVYAPVRRDQPPARDADGPVIRRAEATQRPMPPKSVPPAPNQNLRREAPMVQRPAPRSVRLEENPAPIPPRAQRPAPRRVEIPLDDDAPIVVRTPHKPHGNAAQEEPITIRPDKRME